MDTAQPIRKLSWILAGGYALCGAVCFSTARGDTDATTPSRTVTLQPLAELARWIADADHIVVTNRSTGSHRTISGDEVRRIIRAVSSSKRLPPDTPPPSLHLSWTLRFWAGTNCVATFDAGEGFFSPGKVYGDEDGLYGDPAGVLQNLTDELQKAEHAAWLRENEEKWLASDQDKTEASQRLKDPSHNPVVVDKKKLLAFVGELYAAGASNVLVARIGEAAHRQTETEKRILIVVLPGDPEARRKVFSVAEQHSREWPMEESDIGQRYLFYGFE
jgi:hypothetical protein